MGNWNETHQSEKPERIFSQTTVNFLIELIFIADNIQPLVGDRKAFVAMWLDVDFNNRESILTVLPFVEKADNLLQTQYAKEIWKLFESGKLRPDSPLSGIVEEDSRKANVKAVLDEIEDAREEAMKKLLK